MAFRRATAVALALCLTRLTAGAISASFLSIVDAVGPTAMWAGFASVAAGAAAFTYTCVPETKGTTLEDVASRFRAGGGGAE